MTTRDSAVVATLSPGTYSVHTTAAGAKGVALVEVYDANPAAASRLANMSARTQVGAGEDVLILGFVVDGSVPKRMLIRGVGPTLQQYGVPGVLQDPLLRIFDQRSELLLENNDWGGAAELSTAFTQVGAFSLPPASRDAAVILTLPPGNYSAQVSGANGTTGVGLIEVYELP